MKKLIALLIALLCIVLTVSACTGDGKEENTTVGNEEATTVEEITTAGDPEPVTYEDQEGEKYGPIHGAQG